MKNNANSSTFAIETTELTKRYEDVTAVDALTLRVRPGEIYGFLGRNGAGKTTTIRMVLGLVRPTSGSVSIFGTDVGTDRGEAVRATGSLVETATAYPTLTVRENLDLQRRLTGSDPSRVDETISLLGLGELTNRRAGRLSLGNKQRLALARALLSRPRLLILDEPANALDPAGIVEIRHLLRRLADEERITVFVSSHILGEVALLADRIGIVHRGRLVEEFDAGSDSADAASGTRITVRVSDAKRAIDAIDATPGGARVEARDGDSFEVAGAGVDPAAVARAIVGADVDLLELTPHVEDLEARFLRLTEDEK